jgi:ribosomal protein S18 acetylase RimI-like enzyme
VHVREATLSDAPSMARVMVDSFLTAHRGQIPEALWKWRQQEWSYAVSAQGWERILHRIAEASSPQECVYVAESPSGEILGLAMAQPAVTEAQASTAEVCALYVHIHYQRQGMGRRLLAAIAAHLQSQGITGLYIGTLKTNAPARRFYEALGGQVLEERDIEDGGYSLREVVYRWSDLRQLVAHSGSGRNADEPW